MASAQGSTRRGGGRRAESEQRREDLYIAAARLFHSQGYHGTTLAEVAEQVGLTKTAVYHYVRSKEALLYQVYRWLLQRAEEALTRCLQQVSDTPPAERLRAMLLCHLQFLMDNAALASAITYEQRWLSPRSRRRILKLRSRYEQQFLTVLQEGVAAGVFAPETGRLTLLLIFSALNRVPLWFDPNGPLSAHQVAEAAVNYLMRGLLSSRGEGVDGP